MRRTYSTWCFGNAPDWRVKPHRVSNYDITYAIGGRARYTINGTTHEVLPGGLLCLAENTAKTAITYPEDPMHCFSVNFILKNTAGQRVDLPFLR
ncbi:MAG: AraC family ligand binding domain-containing protein [Treponema sp.]|nr:AraC family ligand binding domain-containing protein [Treponema sp.]